MTDDVLAGLYAPFFTTKEGGKGTGLGLAGYDVLEAPFRIDQLAARVRNVLDHADGEVS